VNPFRLSTRLVTPLASAAFEAWLKQSLKTCAKLGGSVRQPWEKQNPVSRACLLGQAAISAKVNAEALRAEWALIEKSANPYVQAPDKSD